MRETNQKRIASKLVSGRLWLTGICGISFLAFVITMCQIIYMRRDILTGSELVSILNVILLIVSNVMTFYFTKNREDMNEEKKNNASFINNQIGSSEPQFTTDTENGPVPTSN